MDCVSIKSHDEEVRDWGRRKNDLNFNEIHKVCLHINNNIFIVKIYSENST